MLCYAEGKLRCGPPNAPLVRIGDLRLACRRPLATRIAQAV